MRIEWITPPEDLRALVHSFYRLCGEAGGTDEPYPAYSAQLAIVLEGHAELAFRHSGIHRAEKVFLKAPQLEAGWLRAPGAYTALAASLTPLGWRALTGLPADKVHDCAVAPADFISTAVIERIAAWLEGAHESSLQPDAAQTFLEEIMRAASHPVRARHRHFVDVVQSWLASELNPPLDALYDRLSLSRRQVQRLSRELFGAAPSQVLMRHRAIRAAMLLSNPDLSPALRDELDTAYFDQAHMIRDIRRFTGRTPANLAAPSLTQKSLDPEGHGETAARFRSGAP